MTSFSSNTENIDYWNSVLSNNPQSPDAIKAAEYYLQNGDSKKAILLCEDSLKYHPQYLTGYLVLINSYISNSDYRSAQSALEKANKIFPNHWAFKPILRNMDDFGYDEKYLLSSLTSEDISLAPPKEVEIDDYEIDTIVEESKTGSIVDSFDIDNYINDAAIEEIDEPQVFDSPLIFPDEYLTINDFKPAENTTSADHDEIINAIMDEHDETADTDIPETPSTSAKNPKQIESQTIKIFNEKYNLENELNQLLSKEDLQVNIEDAPYEEIFNENQEGPSTPKLVSRTLAEVFDMQGRYSEAIETYKALLKNNEITSQEYESLISSLQEKMSTNIDI